MPTSSQNGVRTHDHSKSVQCDAAYSAIEGNAMPRSPTRGNAIEGNAMIRCDLGGSANTVT
eukprot:9056072-Pyramimonas_sp.AAC.1